MSYTKLKDPQDYTIDIEQGQIQSTSQAGPAPSTLIENTLDEPVSATIVSMVNKDAGLEQHLGEDQACTRSETEQ
jgi:hypothetical protein